MPWDTCRPFPKLQPNLFCTTATPHLGVSGARPGMVGLRYIATLKPNKDVLHYYAGFTDSNGLWSPLKALRARQTLESRVLFFCPFFALFLGFSLRGVPVSLSLDYKYLVR